MTLTQAAMAKAKENQNKRDAAKQSKIKRDKAKARKEKTAERKLQSKKKKATEARKKKTAERQLQSKKKKATEARKKKAAERKLQSKKKKASEARKKKDSEDRKEKAAKAKKTTNCKLCGASCELGMFASNACVCRRSNCKGNNVTPAQVTMYRSNNNQPADMTETQVAIYRARLNRDNRNRANQNRKPVNISPANAQAVGVFIHPVAGSFGGPAPAVVGGFGAPRGGLFIATEVSPTREQLLSGDYDVEWSPPSRRDKVMLQEVTVREELAKQDKEEAKKSKKVYDSAPKKIKDLFDRLKKNIKKVDEKNAEAKSILNKTERLDVNSSEFHRLDRRRFELYDEIKVIVHENDELSAALKKDNYKYDWGKLLYGV